MAVTYRPAARADEPGWLLVVAGRAALLYRAHDTASAAELLVALGSGDAVQGALDILARGGVAAAPDFALAAWTGAASTDAVLLVRGDAVIAASTGAGEVRLDGTVVSTWHEQRVNGVTSIKLGRDVAPGSGLPMVRGVVPADGARLSRDTQPAADETPVDGRVTDQPEVEDVALVPATIAAPIVEATITELGDQEAVTPADDASATYAHLFEETIVRSIEDAAVRPPAAEDEAPAEPARVAGDHDGMTIMSGDLAKLRSTGRKAGDGESHEPPPPPPAPPRFVLDVSNGTTESITGTVLVGRSPSVSKVSSGQVPRLVSITGDQDISRNHAQFVLEGDTVVVTDLHSRNGTSIALPGHAPQILRPGEPTPIISGTLVDLGGGTTMTLREEE